MHNSNKLSYITLFVLIYIFSLHVSTNLTLDLSVSSLKGSKQKKSYVSSGDQLNFYIQNHDEVLDFTPSKIEGKVIFASVFNKIFLHSLLKQNLFHVKYFYNKNKANRLFPFHTFW